MGRLVLVYLAVSVWRQKSLAAPEVREGRYGLTWRAEEPATYQINLSFVLVNSNWDESENKTSRKKDISQVDQLEKKEMLCSGLCLGTNIRSSWLWLSESECAACYKHTALDTGLSDRQHLERVGEQERGRDMSDFWFSVILLDLFVKT